MDKQRIQIPSEWKKEPLKDLLFSLTTGSRPSGGGSEQPVGVFSLGGEHITDDGELDCSNPQYVPTDYYVSIKDDADVQPGDILINKDGAKTGKLAIVKEGSVYIPSCINEHLFRLRVKRGKIEPEYLYNFLHSAYGQRQIKSEIQGSAQGGIIRRFAKYVKVFYPSDTEEQAHILTFFRAVDAHIISTRKELDATYDLKRTLLSRLFINGIPGRHNRTKTIVIFRRKIDIPFGWELSRLGSSITHVQYGTNAPANDNKRGYPVIAIPQVISPRLILGDVPYADLPELEAQALRLIEDDVLLIRTNGNPHFMGKSTIVTKDVASRHVVFASYLIRVRTNKERLLGPYLNYFLASPLGRQQALAMANTSAGNYNLGARSLKQFWIPRPDVTEQEKIVELINSSDDAIDALDSKLSSLFLLKKSLLQNLLAGKVRIKSEGVK